MKGKMKKVISLLLSIAMIFTSVNILPSTVEAAVNSSSGSSSWSLVWNDEFNQTVGGAPDSSTWSYDTGHGDNGWGNQEVQRYTNSTDNVRIVDMSSDSGSTDGKALAITAKRENGEITSGRIKTLNKQYMKYGRVEARLRLDDGMRSGVWPAFWMMGNDIESGASWPYCGEIDIMEHRNAEKQIISTLHWNTGTGTSANYNHIYAGSETTNQYGNIDSINDWHDYAVEWYEDVMKFYLDGVCFETLNINSSEMEEFQKEHFILLNLAIGSSNSPFTLGQTVSADFQSATMYVDYIRVYQGKDSAFSIRKSGTSETKPTQTTTGDGFTTCSSEKTSLGGWGYYVLSGNAGKYQNGTNLDDEFVLKLTSNNKSAWGVQAFTKNISVTSGHKYNVSVDVNSSAATGDVLMKDEIGGTEFTNQALSAGNNTLTGSFTANSDTMQFMFNLANVDAGTTLKFSNVKVTDVTGSGEVEVTTNNQETTPASGDSSWEVIGGGDANTWYYDKNSMSGISGVVNIQQPGFAKEKGIYINVPTGISSVSVNGNTEGVAAIQGAGTVVYLSALTKRINTVTINYAGGTGTVIIKNTNGTSDDTTTKAPVTTETQTESQTPTDESVDLSEAKANTPSTDNLEGWNEKTSHGGSSATNDKKYKFYIAKNYDYEGANNDNFFAAEGVWGFFADAKTVEYAGKDANTVSGEAFVFASNSIKTDFDSIWIDGVKITDTALYCQSPTNPDVMTISKSLLDLGNADSKVFYITVKRKTAGDHTFPILVQKYDPYQITVPELDDPNWTPFKDSATQSNIAVNGDQYYIQTTFKKSVTNKANFGLYDKTSSLEQPAWGIPFKDGNANTPFVSFIIGNSASVSAVSVDGVRYPADGIKVANGGDIAYMAQSLFSLNGAKNHIFKVIVYCTNSKQDVAFALKVVGNEVETTTPTQVETSEEATTIEPAIPDDATWVSITGTNGEYQYYIPADYTKYLATVNNESTTIYFGYKEIGAPFKTVKLNGADYTNSGAAYVQIKKAELENGKNYKLEVTSADGNTTVPFYVRKSAVKDYAPTGVAGTVDKSGLASIAWTPSQDAVNAGYTYKVTVDGKDATVTGTTATYQFTEGSYGTYEVVVSTIDGAGNVLASAKTNIEYRAPISFKDDAGQWEKCRYEEIKWTAVDDAVKYAVYVDGKLYQTIEDPTQEMTTVPAYAFANGTNANGQPTTVGTHTSAIVVIKDGDEVKENLSDVSSDNIMGQNKFTLYVNYIYGKGTNLWNKSGTESKWNFTVCEAAHSNITTGADVKVDYNSNGFADLTFNNMGKHSGDDQAWTIKAAIYDEAAKNGETQNLGFNIYGPKELIGQTIRIKCCREEVRDGSYTGPEDIYEEKDYTFVKDKDGNAVIEYSMSFVSTNDSYDLLFGLGNLNFKDATGKTLTLSDADISTVYGITDLKATGTNTETETGDLFVSWSTNIPNRMLGSYTYQVIIDDKVYKDPTYGTEIPGKVQNITAKDYAVGEHTVVVKSIYHSTITSSKEDKAIISKIKKPDLVITDISVPEGTHYIGDTVTVSVTMKNIGNADAVPEAGKNLSVSLFDILSDGTAKQIGNRICHDHEKELINGTETNGYIKAGDTFTAEFPYEIKQLDDNTNFYKLKAVADYDKVVDEGEDEDNNEYTKRFKFYDPLKEVTFTKNNGSIVATWPASNDIKEYIVKYVVNGETKTKTVTANKCDFGDLVAFDEGSTVSVITVGSDDDEHVHAQGKPLSDLIISDVSTPKTMYVEGEVIPITLTMKNVGFTAGTAAGNLTIKPIKGGEFLTTGIEGDPWKIVDSPVAVNDKRTVTFNYTVQKEDVQAGTINIGGMADADNYPNGFMTECDETNNKKEVTISILSGTWTQSLASDNISNPNTLPMYYCGTNPQETNDTCNVENYDGQLYETTGALWYNSKDIKLSSISVYNGNWLSVATSEYVRFANDNADGTKNWKVQIARAQVDPTNNNKFVGKDGKWYDVDPNTAGSHVGIQGTNTIHIGLPWLTENLPIHSDKGGQKDTEFYWIRIVPDTTKGTSDSDNPSQDNINNYKDGSILIPVALHADIPQIQPAQNINAQMSYDDDDNSVFTVSWSELPEQVTYGYTYKIFIGDEEIGGPYTQQQILTFDYNTYQDKLKAANNKVTVKAYWCEQEISTDVEVKAEAKEDWHLISGQSEINIQAGQSKPVQTPGTISFYYNRGDNHVNSVIGYNGDYIAINGNAKYYNAKSKVSVTSGFTTRAQVKAAREAIKNGTADSYNYSDVEKYNYIDGQLQIMAKNLMTANHLTTCYLVKVETTNDDGTSYTSYIMLESVVEAKGNVEIRGFQMNTDATPGAVSEFAPSFRVVSRAGKIAAVQKTGDTEDNPSIEAIVARGTIYALAGGVSNDDMTVTYTPSNDNTKLGEISSNEEKGVHQFTATEEKGIVTNWSGAEGDNDKDNYDYYAVTFKPVEYVVQGLTQEYKVRAYAISENGTVIYDTTEENGYEKPVVPTVSIYKMAEYLYNNSMMPNEAAHDYLYDNVLNIVSITNNYINITKQMLKALGITSKNDENYKYVNAMYRDLYYYVHLAKNYAYKSYMDRGKFTSKTQFDNVDNETILLKILNDKLNPDTPYTSVADWITRNVTENGFYQVKKYERATANTGEQV